MKKIKVAKKILKFIENYINNINLNEIKYGRDIGYTHLNSFCVQVGPKLAYRVRYQDQQWTIFQEEGGGSLNFVRNSLYIKGKDLSKKEHAELRDYFIRVWKIVDKKIIIMDERAEKIRDLEQINEIIKIVDNPIDNILLSDEDDEDK
ncbi:MAG: hypothetical protein HWN81_00075 [Candidatus Lokiarchaeota archaeon]|nr:hypothetical protein [Candidatus Lokiarchaeota archaeon]